MNKTSDSHVTTGDPAIAAAETLAAEMLASHALIIGVSSYANVRKLPPTSDASDVAALLRDAARGGYAPTQVTVLTEQAATRAAILTALDQLAAKAATSSRVLVYFSGHGGSNARESYLVPVDGVWGSDQELARTLISSAELNQRLRSITADQVTVILDCCRAAGVADATAREQGDDESVLRAPLLDGRLAKLASGKGRAVLAASVVKGPAYVLGGATNGVFTHHLLDGLRGAAHRASGLVRVFDLYHHVREHVVVDMPAQRPVFKAELEENYPLVRCPGATPPLPALDDGFEYDAFISYDPSQRAWVESVLRRRLIELGLRVSVDYATFRLGRAWTKEVAHAVERSRYTVAVITPDYLARGFQDYEGTLATFLSAEEKRARFVPVLRGARAIPPLDYRIAVALDLTDETKVGAGLERLALSLREPL